MLRYYASVSACTFAIPDFFFCVDANLNKLQFNFRRIGRGGLHVPGTTVIDLNTGNCCCTNCKQMTNHNGIWCFCYQNNPNEINKNGCGNGTDPVSELRVCTVYPDNFGRTER